MPSGVSLRHKRAGISNTSAQISLSGPVYCGVDITYVAVSSSEDISGVDEVPPADPPVVVPQRSELSTLIGWIRGDTVL